jgi:hypothetical protein
VKPFELLCDFRHREEIICGISAASRIDFLRYGAVLRAERDPIAILNINEVDLNMGKTIIRPPLNHRLSFEIDVSLKAHYASADRIPSAEANRRGIYDANFAHLHL